jgi:hypothetical protein
VYLAIILRLACFALFWLGVPFLLSAHVRSKVPMWLVIAAAMALGWLLTNGAVYFEHRTAHEADRREMMCFDDAIHEDHNAAVVSGNGMVETAVVENPCGIGDRILDTYKPFLGLIYGPIYLLCCSLPYWLIVARRASLGPTWRIAVLSIGALAIEWTAIIGSCFGYNAQICAKADPYIWPPLTIAAASMVSWVLTTQVIRRFGRRA